MDFKNLVEWYKYILKFSPFKYLGITIMGAGSLYMIYRFLFLSMPLSTTIIGIALSIIIGSGIWHIGWDPYA